MRPPPEILAPVGNWDMLRAAVHNGADAVYMGMPGFNARGRAPTLELDELQAMIGYAHLYGVRVFLACNILLFERELPDVIRALSEVIPLKPDAFIVQDIGLARLIRFMAPEQLVHASTQMTVTCSEAITLTEDLGFNRYVLGREVSIAEMEHIRQHTEKELEVFVHGALCVSYSGQCLTSESMGGRSANRGQCAQSCRLPYDLVVDGAPLSSISKSRRNYVVSPQDLCGLNDVPRLIEIGIESFKIEGRLKSPEYVASTARAYKERSIGALSNSESTNRSRKLARIYSRGFYNGWFDGVNHQKLVNGYYSSHHGLHVGSVVSVDRQGSVIVMSSEPLLAGDGIVMKDYASQTEIGGTIYTATRDKAKASLWRLTFNAEFPLQDISPSMELFVNSSPHHEADQRRSFTDRQLFKKIPLLLTASGEPGRPLTIIAKDIDGNIATISSTQDLQLATKSPLTSQSLAAELGALGGTVFKLTDLAFNVQGSCFIHNRELKEIRRTVCHELQQQRIGAHTSPPLKSLEVVQAWLPTPETTPEASAVPSLNVLVREISQLQALQGLPLSTVYLDFEFGKEYGEAARYVRDLGYRVGIATTRILKPKELGHLKVIQRIQPDEVLVRNLGALQYLRDTELKLIGDFSLNISNSLSAQWFLTKGISTLTPSYDLNGEQLLELASAVDPTTLEITLHHYIPAFHMEHCVFAAFLSTGSSYRDCGRPCEKHRVELQDLKGTTHPLKADAECRNTMFNGRPQSAATLVPQLRNMGTKRYRIETLFEDPLVVRETIHAYAALLNGTASVETTIARVGATEKVGVTDGQLYNIRTYNDRKKPFVPLAQLGQSADPGLKAITE